MKKTFLCAVSLTFMTIIAYCLNWIRPAAIAVLITAASTLMIMIPEIRRTLYEIKRNKD